MIFAIVILAFLLIMLLLKIAIMNYLVKRDYRYKRFIKVDEDQYIPLVRCGNGRIARYNWKWWGTSAVRWLVINFLDSNRYIFSEDEILKMAKEFDKDSPFKKGTFVKWLGISIKNAQPLETYLKWGNELAVTVQGAKHTIPERRKSSSTYLHLQRWQTLKRQCTL